MTRTLTTRSSSARPRDRSPRFDALTIGPWHTRQFTKACERLPNWQTLAHVDTLNQACDHLSSIDLAPELILIAQPLPGTVRQEHIDRLQALAPLARIVVVAGSWCEGELRTGHPSAGALRLYWHELAPWWRAGERRLRAGLCPSWSMPLDGPQAGRYCVDSQSVELELPGIVAIDTDDYAVYEALADTLTVSGSKAIWAKCPSENPLPRLRGRGQGEGEIQAGIWDGGQLDEAQLARLSDFCRHVQGPVAALLDYPRPEHVDQSRGAGATAVFGKPYVVEEVMEALR